MVKNIISLLRRYGLTTIEVSSLSVYFQKYSCATTQNLHRIPSFVEDKYIENYQLLVIIINKYFKINEYIEKAMEWHSGLQ